MAITPAILRQRIRDLIGDTDSEQSVVSPFRLDLIINKQVHRIASRTIRPRETVQSITLVASTYDYALASSGLVEHVAQVFLDADGTELYPVPFELFNSRYRQATSEPLPSGTPREYTLWETAAQVMTLRIGPTPNSAADGPLKVYHSILPAMLSTSTYAGALTTQAIPFSDELIAGLEAACAAEVVSGMNAQNVEPLGLDKGIVVPRWEAEAEGAIRQYNLRQLKNGQRQDRVLRTWHRFTNRLAVRA